MRWKVSDGDWDSCHDHMVDTSGVAFVCALRARMCRVAEDDNLTENQRADALLKLSRVLDAEHARMAQGIAGKY